MFPADVEPLELRPEGHCGVSPQSLHQLVGYRVWRYVFALPAQEMTAYELAGTEYPVAAALSGDLRVAYISCNGQEEGDRQRDAEERNRMWRELHAAHEQAPFHLFLHGEDQLYADEVLESHPDLQHWRQVPKKYKTDMAWREEYGEAAAHFLFHRYLKIYAQPEVTYLMARVPSGMYPLPGRKEVYSAVRNFLVLERQAGSWTAAWYLEGNGWTPPLSI